MRAHGELHGGTGCASMHAGACSSHAAMPSMFSIGTALQMQPAGKSLAPHTTELTGGVGPGALVEVNALGRKGLLALGWLAGCDCAGWDLGTCSAASGAGREGW